MSDNPLDRIPRFNRLSLRAVLTTGDEDVRLALAEAGIVHPISIPVQTDDDLDAFGTLLGDGVTPNLTAVLESDQEEDWSSSFEEDASITWANNAQSEPSERQSGTRLPAQGGTEPTGSDFIGSKSVGSEKLGPDTLGRRSFAPMAPKRG